MIGALEAHLAAAPPAAAPRIEGYELNISCPNVSSGLQIGADPAATAEVVGACREATGRFLLAKLTPNVRDVTEIGAAALGAGADGLSLVNTFKALVLDRHTLRPFLGNRTGGLCGPAIKPIALRMVAEVAQAFPDTPLVGMGGVMTGPRRARVHRLRRHGGGGRRRQLHRLRGAAAHPRGAPRRAAGARVRVGRRGARRGAPRLTPRPAPRGLTDDHARVRDRPGVLAPLEDARS